MKTKIKHTRIINNRKGWEILSINKQIKTLNADSHLVYNKTSLNVESSNSYCLCWNVGWTSETNVDVVVCLNVDNHTLWETVQKIKCNNNQQIVCGTHTLSNLLNGKHLIELTVTPRNETSITLNTSHIRIRGIP